MKKALNIVFVLPLMTLMGCTPTTDEATEPEKLVLETEQQQRSYAMGASVGQIMHSKIIKQKEAGIEYDKETAVKGFIDALNGQSQLDLKEILSVTREVETLVRDKMVEMKALAGEENKAKGLAFLSENATRAGIKVTDSGLQYEVLKVGKGKKPRAIDTVKVHYRGTLLDGTEFDSSYARDKPSSFPLNRVIKGWTEGVQLMSEGAKYKFYVPSNLAYGGRATGKISSHSTLIFEIELLDIIDKTKPSVK